MGQHYDSRHLDAERRFPPKRAFHVCRVLIGSAEELEDSKTGRDYFKWSQAKDPADPEGRPAVCVELIGRFLDEASARREAERAAKKSPEPIALFADDGNTLAYFPGHKAAAKAQPNQSTGG